MVIAWVPRLATVSVTVNIYWSSMATTRLLPNWLALATISARDVVR